MRLLLSIFLVIHLYDCISLCFLPQLLVIFFYCCLNRQFFFCFLTWHTNSPPSRVEYNVVWVLFVYEDLKDVELVVIITDVWLIESCSIYFVVFICVYSVAICLREKIINRYCSFQNYFFQLIFFLLLFLVFCFLELLSSWGFAFALFFITFIFSFRLLSLIFLLLFVCFQFFVWLRTAGCLFGNRPRLRS